MQQSTPEKSETRTVAAVTGLEVAQTKARKGTDMNTNLDTSQSEAEQRRGRMANASYDLGQAMHIARLMQWVERARQLCDAISSHANISPSFRNELQAAQIAWANPDWTDEVSDGLATLHAIQLRMLSEAYEVVEPETLSKAEVH